MKPFKDIISRRLSRSFEKASLPRPESSIVTFSFDDCPLTAIDTALPILEAEDWRATIYVAAGLCGTENHLGLHMSHEDIKRVYANGHEIGDHTFSHTSAMDVSVEDYIADIDRNQEFLKTLGIPESRHFAYPFGHVRPAIKKAIRGKFLTLRGVISPDRPDQDANLLKAMRVYSGKSIEAAINQIHTLEHTPQWLHLFTHDVRDNPSEYGCTEPEFRRVVDAVKESNAQVMTVDQAFNQLMQKRTSS